MTGSDVIAFLRASEHTPLVRLIQGRPVAILHYPIVKFKGQTRPTERPIDYRRVELLTVRETR